MNIFKRKNNFTEKYKKRFSEILEKSESPTKDFAHKYYEYIKSNGNIEDEKKLSQLDRDILYAKRNEMTNKFTNMKSTFVNDYINDLKVRKQKKTFNFILKKYSGYFLFNKIKTNFLSKVKKMFNHPKILILKYWMINEYGKFKKLSYEFSKHNEQVKMRKKLDFMRQKFVTVHGYVDGTKKFHTFCDRMNSVVDLNSRVNLI